MSLPAAIGQLINLQTLSLRYCKQLVALPAEIGQLAALRTLIVDYSLRNRLSTEIVATLAENKVELISQP